MIQLNDLSWIDKYLRAGGSRPIYYVKIIKSEGTVDPDGGSGVWPGTGLAETERWFATGPVDWSDSAGLISEGTLCIDRMNRASISEVVFKVNADRDPGGVASTPGFRFSLDNSNCFYKQLEDSGVHFEGRKIELFLSFAGEATRDNDIQLFSGFLTDQPLKKDSIEIRVEGKESRRDKEMPPNIFEDEVSEDESMMPLRAVGKPIPLVFGSHDMAEGFLIGDLTADGAVDYGRRFKFADPNLGISIGAITNVRLGDPGLIDACGGFADVKTATAPNLPAWTPYSSDVADCAVYFVNIEDDKLYLRARISMASALRYTLDHVGSSVRNAIDGDPASFVLCGPLTAGSTRVIACKVPQITLAGTIEKYGDFTGIFMQHIIDVELGTGGYLRTFLGTQDDTFNSQSDSPAVEDMDLTQNGSYDTWSVPQSNPDWQMETTISSAEWAEYESLSSFSQKFLKYAIRNFGGDGDGGHIKLYETILSVYFGIDVPEDGIFAVIEGYVDDASGTITGTADALVENPAHLTAFLLEKFGVEVNVDHSCHQTVASSDRFGWVMARNILERKDLQQYLTELCKESLLFSWTDEAGIAQVFPMSAPAAPAGVDFILGPGDVSHGIIDQPSRTPLSEVVTDFIVKYKFNPVRDEFDEQLICNEVEATSDLGSEFQSVCAWAKYNNGGIDKKETIELEWVRDKATAVEITKKLIRWHSTRRWVLAWDSDLALIATQVGDSFTVELGWLSDQPESLTSAVYRVSNKRLDPKTDTIKFSAVQVFE